MPGDLGRIRRVPPGLLDPADVLKAVDNGSKDGQIKQDGVSGSAWSDTGRYTLPHHI